ncbi:hypothetical protein DGG96_00725 [Legionella qingyii]|uniref:Uncharacterized protein n=1 Tax=Legionella qingyii TaxID=2184757 RepID=A0A317UAT7_9GAMM|nr:hypothetical protein [Legionella qingyii]PWY57652.1 hypothetical protein DGG96_00725 [Legionella qingyii]RUR25880.1 hypothetical protein ELY20_01665 [Legionella qingyii]RUR29270.1 hypothetical protein ELY16_00290 [Legionella qingyii]
MMIKMLDKTHFELEAFAATMCLDKQIIVSDLQAGQGALGHHVDYFDSATSYVTLQAERDARFMLWESHALLEPCQDNFILNVHFKLSANELALFGGTKDLEAWCVRNRMVLHKLRDEAHLTYYFTLFDAHKITGELLVSPVLYFAKNPVFTLQAEEEIVSQFVKAKPIVLEVKKNQIVCFDKYHYQMAYHPDFNFIRVHDVHRSH